MAVAADHAEPTLLTDQDNALAYAEGGAATDAYFGWLAERDVSGLHVAGRIPLSRRLHGNELAAVAGLAGAGSRTRS